MVPNLTPDSTEVDLILTGKLMVPNLTPDFIEADLILIGLGQKPPPTGVPAPSIC
jgi:hypothetical protein